MEDYPRTLLEFEDRFRTEQACRAYLVQLRWPAGFQCRSCGGRQRWQMRRRGALVCRSCRTHVSITAGTIFQDSHLPLRVWFRAMWWVTNQKSGMSALGLQRALGLGSYRTAWSCLQKLRRAMVRPGRDRLTGAVEADEAFLGGSRPGKRGRGAAGKTLVVVVAQVDGRRIGRIRLRRVSDASARSLEQAIQEAVVPGSVIRTDGLASYHGLAARGYGHEIVRKEAGVGDNLLPRVNRVVALFKRWLLGIHQGAVSREHLEAYLDEFTFRFNRRLSHHRGKLFYRLVQQAVAIDPVPYRTLLAHERLTVASSA